MAVVAINLTMAAIALSVAWRLWCLSRSIDRAANAILYADRVTYNALHPIPPTLAKGQQGTRNLRDLYSQLERQVNQVRQILAVLNWIGGLWFRRGRRSEHSRSVSKGKARAGAPPKGNPR
ncbi:hypothetical protein [Oxynema aestuarii]|uniref:Uncharacterized protein n=1 Tax=Oxynema aestuarii AP17 TaxID=2064643 RepID=A0A6H1U2Q8_9CYAN|nr:hypothetical protein [Oxynema aestuarii]QIZ73111.1 hypothetical protein HCG48_23005 [Oxynema aestuarii AP17]